MKPSKETRRSEGRNQPREISRVEARVRTQSRVALPPNLARVNAAARRAAQTRFTALLHHVDTAALERAFRRQKRLASAGVDGMTAAACEQDLEANLRDPAHDLAAVYTPQIVVDGKWQAVGSDRADIEQALGLAAVNCR